MKACRAISRSETRRIRIPFGEAKVLMKTHIGTNESERTNPLGRHFGLLKASDMILVDYEGNAIGGSLSRPANAAGFLIHSAVHRARPDVIAACHTHSPAGKAWSTFARPLEMLNQDVTYFYGEAQAVYKVRSLGPVSSSTDC